MAKIKRKLLAHFINTTKGSGTAVYERLGSDLEEYNVEMSANVESKKNILGETSVTIDSYEKTGAVEPYYADDSTGLFTRLQNILDNEETLDDLIADVVDVHLWEPDGSSTVSFEAIKYPCKIEVTSYGGDTTGYQIPFTIHYTEAGIKGKFNINTKVFTPNASI